MSNSVWKTKEMPALLLRYNVDYIWTMNDNALTPDDHYSDLIDEADADMGQQPQPVDLMKCHEVTGIVYVEADAAAAAIVEFCKQSISPKEYVSTSPIRNHMLIGNKI